MGALLGIVGIPGWVQGWGLLGTLEVNVPQQQEDGRTDEGIGGKRGYGRS